MKIQIWLLLKELAKKEQHFKIRTKQTDFIAKSIYKKNNRKIKYKEEFLFILKNLVAS